jgi:hypothetical protein
MHNDIKDSIKARLYDMKYTPFLASYVFFFIYFNAKLFLIFFDGDLSSAQKIDALSYDAVCHWKPIAGALFYTLVFPFFQIGFYSAKLWFDKQMNTRKQKIEDQTLLSVEESKDIRYAHKKLEDELDAYIKKYEQTKKDYENYKKDLITEYESKEKELEGSFDKKIKSEKEPLVNELKQAQKNIAVKDTEIEKLTKDIEVLKSKQTNSALEKAFSTKTPNMTFSEVGSFDNSGGLSSMVANAQRNKEQEYTKLIENLNEDEKVILKAFYESDHQMMKSTFKDNILKNNNMKKVTSEKAIQSLVRKKIVLDSGGVVSLSDDLGLELVNELFRETKK